MSRIKPTQRIFDVVNDIKNGIYRLPSIQRSFVWDEERIYKLMDSLLRDYPIGSFLVWKPVSKSRSKRFVERFETGTREISEDEYADPPPYLVLDGQQRLQSLYIAFFGTYDANRLFFSLDSNPKSEGADVKYRFQFLTQEGADQDPHWVSLARILEIGIPGISSFVDKTFAADEEQVRERIKENMGKFIQVFNIEENIPIRDVREDLSANDILEVFVRVNSGGIVLSKSDLIFSTLLLELPDMERKFIDLVDELNGRGEFDFDIDFLVRTTFALLEKGARYEIEKMKDEEYAKNLDESFDAIRNSLLTTIEFLKSDAKTLGKRFLKSDLALIPIVDFLYRQTSQQVPDGQAAKLRKYLYMSFFMRFYSYGADGKLDVIHSKIKDGASSGNFPIEEIGRYMTERTGLPFEFSEAMLGDLDLVLNVVQSGVSEVPRRRGWSLERDHIFPKSVLKDFPDNFVNSVGNLRLVNKTRNILKSDKIPDEDLEFFGSDDRELKQLFLKARKDLTPDSFEAFVRKREQLILSTVRDFLG